MINTIYQIHEKKTMLLQNSKDDIDGSQMTVENMKQRENGNP